MRIRRTKATVGQTSTAKRNTKTARLANSVPLHRVPAPRLGLRQSLFVSASTISLAAALSLSGAGWLDLLVVSQARAQQLPTGGQVVGGSAVIGLPNSGQMLINQTTDRAIINWQSFSIGQGGTTHFQQPGVGSATLNRVISADPSAIHGQLTATGRLYLVNPNGILVGPTGRIDTGGGFVGSTLDINNAAFMNGGNLLFSGDSAASIINLGTINSIGGDIVLLANRVQNAGTLNAPGGYVGLGAGSEVLLTERDTGQGRIMVRAGRGSIENSGNINAALAELRAAGGNQYALAINNTGIIRATGATRTSDGRVLLTANSGNIRSTGRIEAKKADDAGGGSVRISAQTGTADISGDINASGDQGAGGSIIVEASQVKLTAARLDASGLVGGGVINVGGGLGGKDTTVANATTTTVDKDSVLKVDSLQSGVAGSVVVWSDGTTTFDGSISARAFGASGNGGFAEVSGKEHLIMRGHADLRAAHGSAGTLLLDPGTVTIQAGGGANVGPDTFDDSFIVAQLGMGNLTIATSGANAGTEDININAGTRIIWNNTTPIGSGGSNATTLRLQAGNNINALDDVIIQNTQTGDGVATTGTRVVTNTGGVVFLAGKNINIGSATGRTGAVAIGSEFGQNIFIAGVAPGALGTTNAAAITPGQAGTVNVIGGDVKTAFSQLGYIQNTLRGNNTGNDFSGVGNRAANGDIIVRAGTDVNVISGGNAAGAAAGPVAFGNFAQIGHGGARFLDATTGRTISTAADIVSNVEVTSGYDSGHVNVQRAIGGTDMSYAQIGHGAFLFNGNNAGIADQNIALAHGNISGNIVVAARNSDINVGTTFTTSADGTADQAITQIGSGGHLYYFGPALSGVEATHGAIQGDITVTAGVVTPGTLNIGTAVVAGATADRYTLINQIGHGGHIAMRYDGTTVAGDGTLTAVHGNIAPFTDLTGNTYTTNISATAGAFNIIAQETTQNSAADLALVVDNLQRSQLGHGMTTRVEEAGIAAKGAPLHVAVVDGSITGNILVVDNDPSKPGITISSTITSGAALINDDAMIARIGHAALAQVDSNDGEAITGAGGRNGGSISVVRGDISGNIDVRLVGTAQDVMVNTTMTAGVGLIVDSTAVAQIGHSGDTYIKSGTGGAAAVGAFASGNGGNIAIQEADIRGAHINIGTLAGQEVDQLTVQSLIASGALSAIDNSRGIARIGHAGYIEVTSGAGGAGAIGQVASSLSGNGGAISITQAHITGANIKIGAAGAEAGDILIKTSVVSGATAGVSDDTAVAQIGHSGDIYAKSGAGGVAQAGPYASGNGGDITIVKGTVWDNFGVDGSGTDISVISAGKIAIDSDVASGATALAARNSTESSIGHGHKIRVFTGDGGTGTVNNGAAGGRGGDLLITQGTEDRTGNGVTVVDVARGLRGNINLTAVSATGDALSLTADSAVGATALNVNNQLFSVLGHGDVIEVVTGAGGAGGSPTGTSAAFQPEAYGGRGGHAQVLLGSMLIESDITALVTGHVNIASKAANGATAVVNNDIVESVIGHGQRFFVHSGDGGAGGLEAPTVFLANGVPVFDGALAEDAYLTRFQGTRAGVGAARGGNGGDIRVQYGHITDRDGVNSHTGEADITLLITGNNGTPNSLTIKAVVGAGLSEGVGPDVFSGIGHRNRMYGEGGVGGAGGIARPAFDGAIAPDYSGGRGGDVGILTGDIRGDIIVDAARQVLLDTIAGHGTFTKVQTQIGHSTDLVAVTQFGGAGGVGTTGAAAGGFSEILAQNSGATVRILRDGNGNDIGIAINNNTTSATPETLATAAAKIGGTVVDLNGDGIGDAVEKGGVIHFVAFGTGAGGSNPNGIITVVDVDRDGRYDRLDGRVADAAVPFGRLDYTVVTGLQPNIAQHTEGGWTIQNRYAAPLALTPVATNRIDPSRDHGTLLTEDGRALVGDFSTANGGRGGDALTTVGTTYGDIAVQAGNPTMGVADSIIVRSTVLDGIVATGGPRDFAVARIGHGAFQFSDAGASYALRAAGRVETGRLLGMGTAVQGHSAANGGAAGLYAINASGGRGGDATVSHGSSPHIIGDIYINVPDARMPLDLQLTGVNVADPTTGSRRVTIQSTTDLDASQNTSIAMIGHGAEAAAAAGAWRGSHGTLIGAAEGNTGGAGAANGVLGDSEIATGGRGGDARLTQSEFQGNITVYAGTPGSGPADFSIQILATEGAGIVPPGGSNITIAQIGHGRIGMATGGKGGAGDEGQYMASGGRGGDASITQRGVDAGSINIVTVDPSIGWYGNGMKIDSTVGENGLQIVRAQVGHRDLGFVEGGAGGSGTVTALVNEQLNQTANGGRGGDGVLSQRGYNGDINVDLGPNMVGDQSLTITTSLNTIFVGDQNHVLAAVGHGGYGQVYGGVGGNGGNHSVIGGITSGTDPNWRAGGLSGGVQQGIDPADLATLGTERNGGRGGDAISDIGVNGTTGNIRISLRDDLRTYNATTNTGGAAAGDGLLIEAKAGQGGNQDRAIDTNTAMIGHSGFNRAVAGVGGNAIQGALGGTISSGDGGDGGTARASTGFASGSIVVRNDFDGITSNSGGAKDVDFLIRTLDTLATDGAQHNAQARAGHFMSNEAIAGNGGHSATPGGPPPAFLATISARGGDGGNAIATQGQLAGDITLTAENSVKVLANAALAGSPTLRSGIGHRLENDTLAGNGGLGGLSGAQNLYFIYEALREYEANGRNLSALSDFERQLIEPLVSGYYGSKNIAPFLEKMVRAAGAQDRDNNFVGGTNFTIPTLSAEEQQVLQHLMAASGSGGSATSVQGGPIGSGAAYATNGNITVNALSRNLTDAARGIIVNSSDVGLGGGMQIAQIGHQVEQIGTVGGNAAGIRAYSNGMGGDGGNASATQYAFNGQIALNSDHKITIEASDVSIGGARQRAWVGHRQTMGPDRPDYRLDPVIRGGDGGSELDVTSDGRNGNGGNVSITQHAVISGVGGNNVDILLSALRPADDKVSISIKTNAVGLGAHDVEAHVGHDMLVASAQGGDAGRRHALHGPEGLDLGVLEGKGGDLRIVQGSLGADIRVVGRDTVNIVSLAPGAGAYGHTIVGHERTIGASSDSHDGGDGALAGLIRAGHGGDSVTEDYNRTASSNASNSVNVFEVKDADGGSVYITTGTLSGRARTTGDDTNAILITSLRENVNVKASDGLGIARTEIGLSQHMIAQAGDGGVFNGITGATAGEGGDIIITRGEIGSVAGSSLKGDILIQALDQGAAGGKQVFVEANSPLTKSQVLIGHETETYMTSGRSGYGQNQYAALTGRLGAMAGLTAAGTGVAGEATIRDARDAVLDLRNTVRVIDMALTNAERYAPADAAALTAAQAAARAALANAEAALNNLVAGTVTETAAVNAVRSAAAAGKTALDSAKTAVDHLPGASSQLADHANGGNIIYAAADSLATGLFQNNVAPNEGSVAGDVTLRSGRDTGLTGAPTSYAVGTGVVNVTTVAGTGNAHTEVGHRRTMVNTTGLGGGRTIAAPGDGGVAGNGGSISVANLTIGNVALMADEVVVHSLSGIGFAETHLLHDIATTNEAGFNVGILGGHSGSDIETKMGHGGNITSTQDTTGSATISANNVSSAIGARDSKIESVTGVGVANTHIGIQSDQVSKSASDPTVGGTGSKDENRGGHIVVAQTTAGDVVINLSQSDATKNADLSILSTGTGLVKTRIGHEVNQNTEAQIKLHEKEDINLAPPTSATAFSGNPLDDGGRVTVNQTTTMNIITSRIEDMLIETAGAGNSNVYLGNAAHTLAQSGMVHGALGDRNGGVVTANQTVTGNIPLAPARSFQARTGAATSGEVHIGHEGRQTAKSADDGATPAPGQQQCVTGVQCDVNANQVIAGAIGVTSGEIIIESQNANRVQLGHEAFQTATTDNNGVVLASSRINAADAAGNADDIVIASLNPATRPANGDGAVVPATGVNGDLTVRSILAAGEAQIGHRSTSTMSSAPPQGTGAYRTLQAIGSSDVGADGRVTNTGSSVIAVSTFRDLRMQETSGGVAQIGHYITETGPLSGAGAAQTPNSLLRQVVGSDIVIGSGGTGTGTGGVGNSLIMEGLGAGRVEIGHRSPGTNQWQVAGSTVVTPQILDGRITVEVGTDAGGVINGATTGGAAPGGGPRGDDDALLFNAGASTVRIGHNHTAAAEASGNKVQISAGDIWLRTMSDLHVTGGAIGHEHYQHTTTPGTINPETAVGGIGTVRNRIQGITTIGAGQNSPLEDTVLTANVMKFDGSTAPVSINSGYGGRGGADVNGQLRFFIPAQQNLTIVPGVRFNDSVGAGDPVTARSNNPANVFAGAGGQDHEHYFDTMATSRDYTDQFIGSGNFTFYFEPRPAPVVPDIDLIRPIRESLHSNIGGGFDCSGGSSFQRFNPNGSSPNHPGYFTIDYEQVNGQWVRSLERRSAIERNSYELLGNNGDVQSRCFDYDNVDHTHLRDYDHHTDHRNVDRRRTAAVGGNASGGNVSGGGNASVVASAPQPLDWPMIATQPPPTVVVSNTGQPLVTVIPSAPLAPGMASRQYETSGVAPARARLPGALVQAGGGVSLR